MGDREGETGTSLENRCRVIQRTSDVMYCWVFDIFNCFDFIRVGPLNEPTSTAQFKIESGAYSTRSKSAVSD